MKQIRLLFGFLILLIGLVSNADFVSADDVPEVEDADIDAYGHVSLNEKGAADSTVEETISRATPKESETSIEEEANEGLEETVEEIGEEEVTEATIEVNEKSPPVESIPSEDAPYIEAEEKPLSTEPTPPKAPFSLASSSEASMAFLKNKWTVAVEKVKGLTPAEVKKAAAGALGAWGAAVGIRFALQRGG
jgi:hypothetical protein